VVHRFRSILAAAETELAPERIREHHDEHLARITQLIRRGQRSGAFRNDLSAAWLVTVAYNLMHAAANECSAGKMTPAEGERAVVTTLLAALTPIGGTVPADPEPAE
jgi:hypothetical protein